MNRRKLLSWFGLGWLASILPSSLIGCSENSSPSASSSASASPTTAATTATPKVAAAPSGNFKEVGTVAQLDKDGQLLSNKIRVVRDLKDKTKLLAVSTVCTHEQCEVKWKSDEKKYDCPCHDAEFALDGKVLKGPAKKPLPTYTAKIENGKVLVSV
jgi:cytochrome b6-f complex iron-sulfur subunit